MGFKSKNFVFLKLVQMFLVLSLITHYLIVEKKTVYIVTLLNLVLDF